jgi:hypothetical protein
MCSAANFDTKHDPITAASGSDCADDHAVGLCNRVRYGEAAAHGAGPGGANEQRDERADDGDRRRQSTELHVGSTPHTGRRFPTMLGAISDREGGACRRTRDV